MNKRYRLCDVEEAVSEMEELMDIADDIAEIDDDMQEEHFHSHPHNTQAEKASCCTNADHQKFCYDIWHQIIYQA